MEMLGLNVQPTLNSHMRTVGMKGDEVRAHTEDNVITSTSPVKSKIDNPGLLASIYIYRYIYIYIYIYIYVYYAYITSNISNGQ